MSKTSVWEPATEVPPKRIGKRTGTYGIVLAPGEVIRRPVSENYNSAGNYTTSFRQQGRTDYKAYTRTVEGKKYLYIARDPEPETISPATKSSRRGSKDGTSRQNA